MIPERKLRERVVVLKQQLAIYEEILNNNEDAGFERPLGQTSYTDEEIEFLKKNKDMDMKELILAFNALFGTDYSEDSRELYNFMDRQGIIYVDRRNPDTTNQIRREKLGTQGHDRIKFVRAYQNLEIKELKELFNKKFGTNFNDGYFHNIKSRIRNNKVAKSGRISMAKVDNKEEKVKLMKELIQKGLSLREISKKIGVSNITIGNWKKEYLPESVKSYKVRRKYTHDYPKFNTREEFIAVLKKYYLGTKEEKDEITKIYNNKSWQIISNSVRKTRNKFNIQPDEVGLTNFPKDVREYNNVQYLKI